jgi:nucleotide-binding universal stress UspA family protein
MFEPILVGVALDDRDAAPLALGRFLAHAFAAPLALVHIYPYDDTTIHVPEYAAALRKRAVAQLEELRPADGATEVSLHALAHLSPAHGLHDAAVRFGARALVVGSSHRGPIGRVVPGGVGERLLHGAPCPVAVAPAGYAGPPDAPLRIGVAVDGSAHAREALEVAIATADATGAEISVFSAAERVEVRPALVTPGWTVPADYAARHHERAEAAVRAARDRIPPALRGGEEVLTGAAAHVLAAASGEVDLLVCGSRGYGPLRSVLLGGVSSALAHKATCPLMIVPRGHSGGRAAERADALAELPA